MPSNLEGTIPDAWMKADAVDFVIGYLRVLRVPGRLRQSMFYKWSYTVGHVVTPDELARIRGEVE